MDKKKTAIIFILGFIFLGFIFFYSRKYNQIISSNTLPPSKTVVYKNQNYYTRYGSHYFKTPPLNYNPYKNDYY